MTEYEIGQEWQLVNGETATIMQLEFENESDTIRHTLGSDMFWRDAKGDCIDKSFDEGLNFSHIVTDVATEPMETSDFSFRLHDSEIKEILASLKSNGFFDALEFGKQVSLATTRRLKAVL
jgi:hypothetical protein